MADKKPWEMDWSTPAPSSQTEDKKPWEMDWSAPVPDVSQLESGLRGAAQGVSFGFADEIEGGLKAAVDALGPDAKASDLLSLYQKNRDEARARNAQAEFANPGTYNTGQIGGAVASSFIPGLGAVGALKGAATVGNLARAGAIGGVVSGLGTSEADLTEGQFGRAALDVGAGAGVGSVVAPIGNKVLAPAIGKGIAATGDALGKAVTPLKEFASNRALQSLDIDPLRYGQKGFEAQQGVARTLLDDSLLKGSRAKTVGAIGNKFDEAAARLDNTNQKAADKYVNRLIESEDLVKNAPYAEPGILGKLFSYGGYTAGAGLSLVHGNPLPAVAVGVGSALTSNTSKRVQAITADKVANLLQAAPERFGKFSNVLQDAASRKGTQGLNATHFLLMQSDADYRQLWKDLGENEESVP